MFAIGGASVTGAGYEIMPPSQPRNAETTTGAALNFHNRQRRIRQPTNVNLIVRLAIMFRTPKVAQGIFALLFSRKTNRHKTIEIIGYIDWRTQ